MKILKLTAIEIAAVCVILFMVFMLTASVPCKAGVSRGEKDLSSDTVTTAWELLMTVEGGLSAIKCIQSATSIDLDLSYTGNQSDCSDANNDWSILSDGKGTFADDAFPLGSNICVRTRSGTTSDGILKCLAWRK